MFTTYLAFFLLKHRACFFVSISALVLWGGWLAVAHASVVYDNLVDVAQVTTPYNVVNNQLLATSTPFTVATLKFYAKLANSPGSGSFYMRLKDGATYLDCQSNQRDENTLSNSTYTLVTFLFSGSECYIDNPSDTDIDLFTYTSFTNTLQGGGNATSSSYFRRIQSDGNTYTTSDCETCTRIISTEPGGGETIPLSDSLIVYADVYVNSEDTCGSFLTYVGWSCKTYVEFQVTPVMTQTDLFSYQEVVDLDTTETLAFDASSILQSASSTYYMSVTIVNKTTTWGLLQPLNELTGASSQRISETLTVRFSMGDFTPQEDVDAYNAALGESLYDRQNMIDSNSDIFGDAANPGIFVSEWGAWAQQFLYLPPYGYVTYFNSVLQNATSSELGDMSLTFQEGTPGGGLTFTLPLNDVASSSIALLNANGGTGEHGNVYDTFIFYWESLWKIIFALWVIYQITGLMNFTSSPSVSERITPQQRVKSTIDMRGGRGTINMRNN